MIKCKVTKKELKENYKNIFSTICDLTYLLHNNDAKYYYSNNYGWRFDVYQIDYDTIITMGNEYLKEYKIQTKINDIFYKYNKIAYSIFCCNYSNEIEIDELIKNLERCKNELKEVLQNEYTF